MSISLPRRLHSDLLDVIADPQYAENSDMHLHSTFSDGRGTPEEMVRRAIMKGRAAIAIVDHVRRSTDWLDGFAVEMARLKHIYARTIKVYSGIEAKVISLEGDIDARPEFYPLVDIVLGAFHRIPKGQDQYFGDGDIAQAKDRALDCWFRGMMALLENAHVHIVAHPGAILKRKGISLPDDMGDAIARKAVEQGKVFEVNSKYQVPDEAFLKLLKLNGVKLTYGSDSHSVDEM